MPNYVTCKTCGTVKRFPLSVAKNRKYCSRACRPSLSGAANPNWKGGLAKRVCKLCSKSFETKQKNVRNGHGNYCSSECSSKFASSVYSANAAKKRIIKSCNICGESISIKQSREGIEGFYCSRKCMAKSYKIRMAGDGNPNYKHGNSHAQSYYQNMRRSSEGFYTAADIDFIKKSQKNKCANCLKNVSTKFHIDHIYPVSKGGSNWPHNLQILCAHCNHSKHAKDPIEWAQENGRLL